MQTKIRLILKQLARELKLSILLLSFLFATPAFAQMTEVLGFTGPGCPEGTLSSTISPDGTALSLLYDQFSVKAQVPTSVSKWLQRRNFTWNQKWCQVHVSIDVPVGYRLAAVHLDQRGFSNLPEDSLGFLYSTIRSYDVAENRLQFLSSQIDYTSGVFQDNFNISGVLRNESNRYCEGGKQTLTLTTYMGVKLGRNAKEEAMMTMDSSDLAVKDPNSTDVTMQIESCPRKFRHN